MIESELAKRNADDYVKFRNDNAVLEIRIGVKEFKCIGVHLPRHRQRRHDPVFSTRASPEHDG